MKISLPGIMERIRHDLKDEQGDDERWSEDELDRHLRHALQDISKIRPREMETLLGAVDGSYEIDISDLDDLVNVDQVAYPADQDPQELRNYTIWGDILRLGLASAPSVTETTLTGTVTFTKNSTAVTGAGTAFLTELAEGGYIKKSTDYQWYKVASITDATHLTLSKAFVESTGADTLDSTPKRDSQGIVQVYWGQVHTLNLDTNTLPSYLTDLLVDGAVAYACTAWANYAVNRVNTGGANVDMEYLRLAQIKMAKFYSDLRGLRKIKVYKDYPK